MCVTALVLKDAKHIFDNILILTCKLWYLRGLLWMIFMSRWTMDIVLVAEFVSGSILTSCSRCSYKTGDGNLTHGALGDGDSDLDSGHFVDFVAYSQISYLETFHVHRLAKLILTMRIITTGSSGDLLGFKICV